MNFSIRRTIARLFAPQHRLSCSWFLWRRLLASLRQRGGDGQGESGAFLLGQRNDGRARIKQFVLYDDLDPNSLKTGIVRFDGRYYSGLWELCRKTGLVVVADVHTHPDGAYQSHSDQANPMISSAGHIAIIVPRFAAAPIHTSELGVYLYEGAKQWTPIRSDERRRFLKIGW